LDSLSRRKEIPFWRGNDCCNPNIEDYFLLSSASLDKKDSTVLA
jgi:hypothetical protein